MDPRKKADDLKASQLSFLASHFTGDPDTNASHAIGLRLSGDTTDIQHTQPLRLTPLDVSIHTTAGLRLPVSQSTIGIQSQPHTGSLQLTDSGEGMHSVGLRLSDADAVHATAMRLSDDSEALHASALRLSESDIPHSTGLRLPLSTTDYGLSSMYSMTSILSGTTDMRSAIDLPKRDHYDIGLSMRPSTMRGFGMYNDDGRLPGISYMMSSQDSSMRAAGLDMTIPTLPASCTSSTMSSASTMDSQTPSSLITGHVFTNTGSSSLFSGRGYGMSGNESDSDSELAAEAAAAHSNLTEAQERFASHLGRMDMKSIIEATKLAVAQQQLNHLAPGPLDLKPPPHAHSDAKELLLDRQLMRDTDVDALQSSLHPSDQHLPLDVSLSSHHQTLADMGQLADAHATDLTTTDLSCPQDNSLTDDSPPSSPGKGKRLSEKRAVQSSWFNEFPWLVIDNTFNLFYCRYCMETSSESVFAKGFSATKTKKEHCIKHEQTEDHREASRRFIGIDTQEAQDAIGSTSQALNLDAMTLTWSSAPTTRLEEMQPVSSDFDTLTTSTTVTVNTGHDPAHKPTIIDSTNAHVLNLVISPRTLTETRAQFEGWFDEFPWLVYDALLNVFQCKVCQQAGEENLLSAGKSSDQLQRTPFENHQESPVHQEAVKVLYEDGDDSSKDEESDSEEDTQTFRIRRIHLSWFLEFLWLELNQVDMCFYCKLCRLYKQPGIFSYGRPAGNPKKHNFLNHENTEGHKIAALQDAGISGEEAVRTVLAMINKGNREEINNKEMVEQAEIDVVTNRNSMQSIEMDLSKKATAAEPMVSDPNCLLSLSEKSDLGRKIKFEWFIEFPWLELDENKNIFYCKLCRIYHPIGIYVSGKSAANPKRDDLRKHEGTEGHKIAVNSHSRAGAEGERRLENHSLDPSNAHLIDITTVSQITQAQNKSAQNISNLSCTSFTQTDDLPPDEIEHTETSLAPSTSLTTLMPVAYTSISTSLMPTTSTIHTVAASDDWAVQFPWYTVESPSQTAYCKVCRAESLSNALGEGVPVYIVMKKDCIVHEMLEEHQRAVETARRAMVERELEEKRLEEEAAARTLATQAPPPPSTSTASTTKQYSPYVIKQMALPADAFSDSKSPWRSSFWQLANQMRHLGILCDVTISVGGVNDQRSYHVHKLLLVCSSELFKTYLRENSLENHYHFDNITPVGLEGILQYIYGQPVKGMTVEQSTQCCAAADILLMPKAKELFQKSVVSTYGHRSKKKSTQSQAPVVQPPPPPPPPPPTSQPLPLAPTPPPQQQQLKLPPPSPPALEAEIAEPKLLQNQNSLPTGGANTDPNTYTSDTLPEVEEEEESQENEEEGEAFTEEEIRTRTMGQLAKKPNIIGRLRPKDRIKTYNSLRSIKTRTRKTRSQKEVPPNQVTRRTTKEVKANGVKSPPTQEPLPPSPSPPPPPAPQTISPAPLPQQRKGKKRAKKEKNNEKVSKQKLKMEDALVEPQMMETQMMEPQMVEPQLVEPQMVEPQLVEPQMVEPQMMEHHMMEPQMMEPQMVEFQIEQKGDEGQRAVEKDLLELTNLNDLVASDSDMEEGLVIDEEEGAVMQQDIALPPKNSNHKVNKKQKGQQQQQLQGEHLPTCDECGKKFLRPAFLARHKEAKHKASVAGSSIDTGGGDGSPGASSTTGNHKCGSCGKGFSTRYDLKIHARRHTGERPYLCNVCGKSFTRRETLIEHSYIHKPDTEKPHRCESCGKGFYKIYDLQRHFVGIHSGARPFQCHLCGKSFPWARSLSDHLQSHKGAERVRPYKCEECDMNFRRKYDLERHKVKHASQKPYVCEWCGHGFTQKGSMDKHKREFCHGRPGAPDSAAAKQIRANTANSNNNQQTAQSSKLNVKTESESLMKNELQGTDLGVEDEVPTMLTLSTEHRNQTDIFPTFSPDSEPAPGTMLYYSI